MSVNFAEGIVELTDDQIPIAERIQQKLKTINNDETSFAFGDLGDIIRKHEVWQKCLPRIKPFYAVKVNNLQPVLKLLVDMGLSFDCASKGEIQSIMNLDVHPSRIIYANTFKQKSFIQYAKENNVSLMTFDCENELQKIAAIFPEAQLVLRINSQALQTKKAKFPLGRKFGCPMNQVEDILQSAKSLSMNIVGVSFHIGSECYDIKAYEEAIQKSRQVFDKASELGFKFNLLDIGGGFPGNQVPNAEVHVDFEAIADVINSALDTYFPSDDVRIIAEPGRYYVASAFAMAANIITKKILSPNSDADNTDADNDESERMYYINDGVYGVLNTALVDPGCYVPSHFKDRDNKTYRSTVWGPTCDSLDLVIDNYNLPELESGDWIYFNNVGAYSFPLINDFNSMPRAKEFFFCERSLWRTVYSEQM